MTFLHLIDFHDFIEIQLILRPKYQNFTHFMTEISILSIFRFYRIIERNIPDFIDFDIMDEISKTDLWPKSSLFWHPKYLQFYNILPILLRLSEIFPILTSFTDFYGRNILDISGFREPKYLQFYQYFTHFRPKYLRFGEPYQLRCTSSYRWYSYILSIFPIL